MTSDPATFFPFSDECTFLEAAQYARCVSSWLTVSSKSFLHSSFGSAGAFLSFALKKTALLFSSCFLPGSTATSGLDNLKFVRASEVYFLLMAVGGEVTICSALRVTSGGGTVDQGDREHLGKRKDIHRENPILGMRWTWTKKKIPECKRSENSASAVPCFPVSYVLVSERVGLHHISCIRRIFTPVTIKINPVVQCIYKRDVKFCLVSPVYPSPCSEFEGISSGVQHTE
ncbi:hypothetical protein F5J12DRAFT_42596 [Pisolithus orientalis]|uniref:uncharacterized protein n=1 Tax=Pisolithus orientalis TaxID=936130 RepID=UPI002224204C|nr:uncharacterized protein F5J12DRAFT_42596 [Pisolithus orientalis]KAI6009563.1 hypothetical protein F5J12DRAFT_42596 [Pisolithus orientalis]